VELILASSSKSLAKNHKKIIVAGVLFPALPLRSFHPVAGLNNAMPNDHGAVCGSELIRHAPFPRDWPRKANHWHHPTGGAQQLELDKGQKSLAPPYGSCSHLPSFRQTPFHLWRITASPVTRLTDKYSSLSALGRKIVSLFIRALYFAQWKNLPGQ